MCLKNLKDTVDEELIICLRKWNQKVSQKNNGRNKYFEDL